jgi:hypothetical protein
MENILPTLDGLGDLKAGETFSFIYKISLPNSAWTTTMRQNYYDETKESMIEELTSLIEKIESIPMTPDLKGAITRAIPGLHILAETCEGDSETASEIIMISGRMRAAAANLTVEEKRSTSHIRINLQNVKSAPNSAPPSPILETKVSIPIKEPQVKKETPKPDTPRKMPSPTVQRVAQTGKPRVFTSGSGIIMTHPCTIYAGCDTYFGYRS